MSAESDPDPATATDAKTDTDTETDTDSDTDTQTPTESERDRLVDPYDDLTIATGVVAEPNTSLVNETGGWRQSRPVIDHETCTGCGICERFCPDNAAKGVGDREFAIDLAYCKGCGICEVECPVDAIEMVPEGSADGQPPATDGGGPR